MLRRARHDISQPANLRREPPPRTRCLGRNVPLPGGRTFTVPLLIYLSPMASVATLAPITLTDRAVVEVKNIIQEKNVPADYGLRIGVQGGGCSGMSYLLGFDKAKDADETYDLDGLRLIMDKKHAMYVLGMEVDFQDGLNARGFVFNNPQAKSTCGCGSSFSA